MIRHISSAVLSFAATIFLADVRMAEAQYAVEVISYNPGTAPASGFTNPAASIGEPERFTGEGAFPGVVSPFNPPYRPDEIVSVGTGGQITLRLSNYAVAQAGGPPEIGIFSNVGLVDSDYPHGRAGSPPDLFVDALAAVEISADGSNWIQSPGFLLLNHPTSGYTDLTDPYSTAPGSALSDFQQSFTGSIADFAGLPYFDPARFDILELLAGSGGGTWIDISFPGVTQIGFVRISLPVDHPGGVRHFELDAVSISHAALGAPTVPEPSTFLGGISAIAIGLDLRRRRRRLS